MRLVPPTGCRLIAAACLTLVLVSAGCKSDEQKLADFLARGEEALENENYDEAVIELRNVLQIDPNQPEAHYGLAKAYTALQKLKEAYWELHEAVRLDPDNIDARISFAQFSLLARDFDEVLAQADAILERDPARAVAYTLKGQALAALGRYDEAEQAFEQAIANASEDDLPGHLLNMVQFQSARGNEAAARPYLDRLVEVDPTYRSYAALGRHLTVTGDAEGAEQAFRKSLDAAGKKNRANAYRNLAGFYFNQGRAADSIATLEKGIEEVEEGKLDLMYLLARFYRSQGDEEKADALVQQATQAAPDDPQPYLVLSAYLGRKGDVAGALEAVDRALEIDPESLAAKLRRAELLIDAGYREKDPARIAEGRAIVDSVLATEPSNPEALFVRAKSEMAELDPKSAVATLRSALDMRPDWAQARFVLGSALMLLGDRNGARAELARAVELDPALLEARRALARVHASLGEHEYAIEQGRIYLREHPDDSAARIQLAQGLLALGKVDDAFAELERIPAEKRGVDAWYALGRLQLATGDTEAARKSLLLAYEKRPHHPDILRWLHRIDSAAGRVDESVARIREAVEAEPDNAALAQLEGVVAFSTGDLAAAEAAFKRAVDLAPDDAGAYQQLAGFYRATDRLDDAIATFRRSVKENPNSARLHERLAILLEYKGDTDEAMKHYEEAIALDPSLAEAKNNLAYLLAEKGGDLDRALDLAQEAKALRPDDPNTADTLGWVLYKRGIPSAAIGYLREALAGFPPEEPAINIVRQHLAEAYAANEQPDKALELIETALGSLDGSQPEPEWAVQAKSLRDRLRAASS